MKPAMFGKKGERILFLLWFVLFSTMNREHVGATSAILSEKPLKLDMSVAKSDDVVVHLKLNTNILKFTAQRPSDSCLTDNQFDNKVEYKYSEANCKMFFGWTNKLFIMNITSLENIPAEHDVSLSFGTTAKVVESSTGSLMDVKGFCKFLPKKTGSFYTTKFTILRNKKPPSCPIVIIFDDSVQLDRESSISMMLWVGGGLAIFFVVVIIIVLITGYFVWKRKTNRKEKLKMAGKGNKPKQKKSKDEMKKQNEDNKADQSNANSALSVTTDHAAFPAIPSLSDQNLPKPSQPQVIPAKPSLPNHYFSIP